MKKTSKLVSLLEKEPLSSAAGVKGIEYGESKRSYDYVTRECSGKRRLH